MKLPFGISTHQKDFNLKQGPKDNKGERKNIKKLMQKSSIKFGENSLPGQFLSTQQKDFEFKKLNDSNIQREKQEIKEKNNKNNLNFGDAKNEYISEHQAKFQDITDEIVNKKFQAPKPEIATKLNKTNFILGKDEAPLHSCYTQAFQAPVTKKEEPNSQPVNFSPRKSNWSLGQCPRTWETENNTNYRNFNGQIAEKNLPNIPEDKLCFGECKQNWLTEFRDKYVSIPKEFYETHKIVHTKDVMANEQVPEKQDFNNFTEYQVSYQEKPYSKTDRFDMTKYNKFNILNNGQDKMNSTYRTDYYLKIV